MKSWAGGRLHLCLSCYALCRPLRYLPLSTASAWVPVLSGSLKPFSCMLPAAVSSRWEMQLVMYGTYVPLRGHKRPFENPILMLLRPCVLGPFSAITRSDSKPIVEEERHDSAAHERATSCTACPRWRYASYREIGNDIAVLSAFRRPRSCRTST